MNRDQMIESLYEFTLFVHDVQKHYQSLHISLTDDELTTRIAFLLRCPGDEKLSRLVCYALDLLRQVKQDTHKEV